MSRPNCIKDLCGSDIEHIQVIAEAQGWTEIRYDMISERQVRCL